MSKILVTGVSGEMGKRTVYHLLKKGVPASDIIGLSRKREGLDDLVNNGVEISQL
jgi:NAD(P)H dehydrogenase (quinone)